MFESDVFDCSVNPALWTLKVEVMFYCCVPVIVWLLRKMRRRWILLAIIYALSVLYRNGLHWYADHTQQHLFVVLARQLPGFMSYFATGMALFLYKDKFLQWKSKLALPALCVAVAEYLLECEWLFPLAFGIVVLWCAYSLPQLNNFARFGDISYGVYIYHAPIIKILYTIGFFAAMNVWLASGLFVCMVLTVSLLSWHLMEKRILQRR